MRRVTRQQTSGARPNALAFHSKGGRRIHAMSEPPRFEEPLRPLTVTEGTKVVLKCMVRGSSLLELRWYHDGKEVKQSPDFLPEFDPEKGTATLTIREVFPDDQGTYSCRAVNQYGYAQTEAPLLVAEDIEVIEESELYVMPQFIQPLMPQAAPEGEPTTLTAEVTGFPEPTLQWFYNRRELKTSHDFQILTEGTKSTLIISEVFPEDAGIYEVRATNPAGQASSITNITVVSEEEEEPKPQRVPPSFIHPLQSVLVPEGEVAILDAEVTADPPATLTWFFNKRPLTSSRDFHITSENNRSTLVICEVFQDDGGEYTCKAENEAGAATSTALLSVEVEPDEDLQLPQFVTQLMPVRVMDGEEATLSCVVTGKPTPKITWYHNDREVRENKDVWTTTRNDGYCELFISEVFPEDMGEYVCQAVNKAGVAVTRTVLVVEYTDATIQSLSDEETPEDVMVEIPELPEEEVITPPPTPPVRLWKPSPVRFRPMKDRKLSEPGTIPKFVEHIQDVEVVEYQSAEFTCKVTGSPRPKVTWYRHGRTVKSSAQIHIFYDSTGTCTLTIQRVTSDDDGEYVCEATNRNGADIIIAHLTVFDLKTCHPVYPFHFRPRKIEPEFTIAAW